MSFIVRCAGYKLQETKDAGRSDLAHSGTPDRLPADQRWLTRSSTWLRRQLRRRSIHRHHRVALN